jgi:integrase
MPSPGEVYKGRNKIVVELSGLKMAHHQIRRLDNMRKRYLNQEELGKLFRTIRKGKNERDWIAYRLVLLLGLRVQELCNLTVDDLDFQTRSIRVQGIKNGRVGWYHDLDEKIFSSLKK